ncbi:hypothetical protein Tco_1119113, partial [Tanacetum coccineum]
MSRIHLGILNEKNYHCSTSAEKWELTGLPCKHGVAAIWNATKNGLNAGHNKRGCTCQGGSSVTSKSKRTNGVGKNKQRVHNLNLLLPKLSLLLPNLKVQVKLVLLNLKEQLK